MAEALKEQFFTRASLKGMADTIRKCDPTFEKETFLDLVFDKGFEKKELKQRMRHVTNCLYRVLPQSYEEALEVLKKAAPHITGFEALSLPDFVELYGMDDWELSLTALKHFTRYSSSELAVRPFIARDPQRTMAFLYVLAGDKDPKVRRLASEGCRPRLPWAMALPEFKMNPAPILPILEKLKEDESDSVRRSVANNLNDISRDHPELVLDICERWQGHSVHTEKIIKHACRTLLKAGNKRALLLFGFGDPDNIKIENLELSNQQIAIGGNLEFSFELAVKEKKKRRVRLEYVIHYQKKGGKTSPKVFQIIEKEYEPDRHYLSRKQTFMDMSTRKHYPGPHQIVIIVNGTEKTRKSFDLV